MVCSMVLGVFRDHHAAQNAVDALYAQGYTMDDINVLMSEHTRTALAKPEEERQSERGESMALEGAGVGGAIGTAVGASLAAIAAIGTSLVIPGLNLIVAGPLIAALAGGGAGAVTGGLVGALAGMGITFENAEVYHTALREGGTVVGVRLRNESNTADQQEKVTETLESFGGKQVHSCRC